MTESISGYAEVLDRLTPGLAALYADWLPRLRAAFGPWKRPAVRDPTGEPDGYGGLSRRGSWERLLVSEWALAREVPEEFVRRAAMREQLFLRLERQVPAVAPTTRVWLDCGPDQLGAPRLVHLAILLVLDRRAREAGGTLMWAPMHAPTRFHDVPDPETLLAQRTASRTASVEIDATDEAFVVASEPVRGVPGMVTVRELAAGPGSDAGIEVATGLGTIVLSLPDTTEIARMLSRPIQHRIRPHVVPAASGDPIDSLRFTPGGGALLQRRGAHLVAWAVPRGPRKNPKVRRVAEGTGVLVAVSWRRQALSTLRWDDGTFTLFGRRGQVSLTAATDFAFWDAGIIPWFVPLPGRYLSGSPLERQEREAVLVRDAMDQMWVLDFGRGHAQVVGAAASDPVVSDSVYSWIDPNGQIVRLFPDPYEPGDLTCLSDHRFRNDGILDRPIDAVLHCGRPGVEPSYALATGRTWWIGRVGGWGAAMRSDEVQTEHRVVGAVNPVWGESSPACVIEVEGGRVWRVDGHGRHRVIALDEPVVAAAVGGRRDEAVVALGTPSGWIHVVPVYGSGSGSGSEWGSEPWLSFVARGS